MNAPAPPLHRPGRPGTVTVAAALLIVQAILGLAGLVVSVALRNILGGGPAAVHAIAKQFAGEPTVVGPVGFGCAVLLSVLFPAMAALLPRGSNAARVAAWVFSGLGLLGFIVGDVLGTPIEVKHPEPHWYLEYSGFAQLLALVSYVAVIALLAVRPSNRYFATRRA